MPLYLRKSCAFPTGASGSRGYAAPFAGSEAGRSGGIAANQTNSSTVKQSFTANRGKAAETKSLDRNQPSAPFSRTQTESESLANKKRGPR